MLFTPLPLSQTVTPSRTPPPLERDVLSGRTLRLSDTVSKFESRLYYITDGPLSAARGSCPQPCPGWVMGFVQIMSLCFGGGGYPMLFETVHTEGPLLHF